MSNNVIDFQYEKWRRDVAAKHAKTAETQSLRRKRRGKCLKNGLAKTARCETSTCHKAV